ncbi:DUF2955 domain-containing protein [Microbulbifer agarilyticus]|uniref:DUF2955 domain-containing protein n=1 Tax=Microbulbifer agarilyticus TaxID=260552 RepID=UPI001CD7EF12|nr:DUF2955 domain-containing protein [Microbulbifer agarilyticus]MCA0893295.1 DUF2955 domain-containing protein [Microbulbifer agarilyticus]
MNSGTPSTAQRPKRMPLAARRCYRLAVSTALALALCYGFDLGIPYLSPIFVVLLAAGAPNPPGLKVALMLLGFVAVALGIGVLLIPLLQMAPLSALLAIALGIFYCNRLAILHRKGITATLLAIGLTVIPAAGILSSALAGAIVEAMVFGMAVAIVSLWLVYPFFPEDPALPEDPSLPKDPAPKQATAAADAIPDAWLSLRATLIVMPAFLLTLTNPATYLPFLVKSILLAREASDTSLRGANRELIGATALGGACAIGVWWCLSLAVELWFFTGWVLLVSLLLASGVYGIVRNTMSPSFWINSLTTMLILLGAAVQDSASGKDVYQALFVRMALFLGVTIYALFAMTLLERISRRKKKNLHPG